MIFLPGKPPLLRAGKDLGEASKDDAPWVREVTSGASHSVLNSQAADRREGLKSNPESVTRPQEYTSGIGICHKVGFYSSEKAADCLVSL